MALGSNTGGGRKDSIFVDLKFNATKGADGVGFRQTLSRTPIVGAAAGEKKFNYETAMHSYVEGHLAGFVTKEEPTYDDPTKNEFIGYATISDIDGGPPVVVKFPLESGGGRRIVGLLNAVKESSPLIHLFTNHAEAGTVFSPGATPLAKPQAYVNLRIGGPKGEKVMPLYCDEQGAPMFVTKDGVTTAAPLAMGEKNDLGKGKIVWTFNAADDMTLNTALVLSSHFAKERQGHHDTPAADGDGGVDLDEAAAAARGPNP